MQLLYDLKELREKKIKLTEDQKNITESLFKEMAKNIFINNQNIFSFSWEQFTKYFNDGDPCYFDTRQDSFLITTKDGLHHDIDICDVVDPMFTNVVADIVNIFRTFELEEYKIMFGDHVRVVVTENGVSTEEYTSHD